MHLIPRLQVIIPLSMVVSFYLDATAFGAPAMTDLITNSTFTSTFQFQCRCFPTQPCWPSAAMWSAFNGTTGGRLIATFPIARVCHDPYYDPVKCREVRDRFYDLRWRQSQPATTQYPNWESISSMSGNSSQVIEGCFGMGDRRYHQPCQQGAVPLYTVKALSIADVQATVRFASMHNIRLTVKNTGHDLLGRSMAPNSISLWMHFMNKVDVVDEFVPEGAPPLPQGTPSEHAIILEPGVLWQDAYAAADTKNRIVVGGTEATVGASGGYCLGGGHSPLSPRHGLCVDNVLQYKIVTPDGELRVVNAYQNQDLFWALRGGGPGFGVVVEAVYRTHPALSNGVAYVTALIVPLGTESQTRVIGELLNHQSQWSKKGWSGTTYVESSRIYVMYLLPNGTVKQAKTTFDPFFDAIRSIVPSFLGQGTVFVLGVDYGHQPSFLKTYNALSRLTHDKQAGIHRIVGSRLIPQSLFESPQDVNTLAATMGGIQEEIEASGGGRSLGQILGGLRRGYLIGLVAGGEVASPSGNNSRNGTSIHPAWRKALLLIQVIVDWETKSSNASVLYTQQLDIQQALTSSIKHLAKLTPGSAAYVNEANPTEPDWQQNFWGDNYQRLYQIKKSIDPQGLFVCRLCVGSEDWNEEFMCPSK